MSNVVSASDPLVSTEITMVANLLALPTSPAGTAITKTGTTTFSNVTTGGAFPQMTTTQRLALTPVNGQTAYDTTLDAPYVYIAGAWYILQVSS